MSAELVCNELVEAMSDSSYGFYVCNFANCDMVGHTGVLPAAVKAVETVDLCLGRIIKAAEENNIILFITADHGNAEKMFGDDGSPNTAHTTNPVPFIICGTDKKFSSSGRLADIAPTILTAMGIEKPEIMTGKSLI